MFGKMMNRFYYGKAGKGDFTKDDLPETRWQLFWEMLRVRFTALFRVNLLYMIAWIPAIIVIARALMHGYNFLAALSEMQMQVESGEATLEALSTMNAQVLDALKAVLMQTLLLLIPCITITGPFTAGLCYVTRNWARDEHSFILSDFLQTAKENWKQGLLTSFITSLMPLLIYVCYAFYGDMAASNAVFMVPQVVSIMVCVLWLCSLIYIYPQMVTYDMTYKTLVRNSFIMAISCLPMTVALKLLSLVPAIIFAVVSLFTSYFVIAGLVFVLYYILLGFALTRFIGASFTNGVFDRMINTHIEGVQVGRGLYQDDEEENSAEVAEENTEA